MKYGDYLKKVGLNPAEAAPLIGISKRSSYRYANGERTPNDKDTLQRIFDWSGGEVRADDFYNIQ